MPQPPCSPSPSAAAAHSTSTKSNTDCSRSLGRKRRPLRLPEGRRTTMCRLPGVPAVGSAGRRAALLASSCCSSRAARAASAAAASSASLCARPAASASAAAAAMDSCFALQTRSGGRSSRTSNVSQEGSANTNQRQLCQQNAKHDRAEARLRTQAYGLSSPRHGSSRR